MKSDLNLRRNSCKYKPDLQSPIIVFCDTDFFALNFGKGLTLANKNANDCIIVESENQPPLYLQ